MEKKTEYYIDELKEDMELSEQQDGALMQLYLVGRLRALKTELRQIESILGVEPSIPLRSRPH